MFTALRHPAFAALWVGTFASNLGGWMHNFASRWIIYDITGDAWMLGLDALLSGLTTAVLLPWGGVLADRVSRRTILITGNVVAAASVATLSVAAAADVLQPTHILAVSLVNGVVNAMLVPANQALLPSVVGKEHLSNAIALNSLQFNVARVIGPLLALTAYWLGTAWCFGLNAVSFLVLAVVLVFIPLPKPAHKLKEPPLRSLATGLRTVGSRGDLRGILVLVVLAAMCSAPVISMLPAYVRAVLRTDVAVFADLQAAFGVGSVVGAVWLTWRAKRQEHGPWRTAVLLAVLGVCEIGLAFVGRYVLAGVLIAVSAAMLIGTMVQLGAANQHAVSDDVRGRVMSLQSLGFRGGQALGSFAAGWLIAAVGVQWMFATYGGTLVVGVLLLVAVVHARGVTYRTMGVEDAGDVAAPAERDG